MLQASFLCSAFSFLLLFLLLHPQEETLSQPRCCYIQFWQILIQRIASFGPSAQGPASYTTRATEKARGSEQETQAVRNEANYNDFTQRTSSNLGNNNVMLRLF